MLLLREIRTKPMRDQDDAAIAALAALLSRLRLLAVDEATAELAVALGADYTCRPSTPVHLATAVGAGADRFLTNNRRDLRQTITEMAITYPAELPEPVE